MLDTEEAFDWDKPFTRSATDVTSMASQVKAHRVFERYGVVPTYLVDYPVVSQDAGRAPLLEMLRDGLCDVGTHLHPWVTPPFLEEVNNRNSYPGNLPLELEFAKLQTLTETIEDMLGLRPQVYRAGRYGVGPRTGDLLRHLGYLVDSSVMANWDFTAQDGPDFTAISARPLLDRSGSQHPRDPLHRRGRRQLCLVCPNWCTAPCSRRPASGWAFRR